MIVLALTFVSVYKIDQEKGLVGQVEDERVGLAEAYSKSFWPLFKSYVARTSQYDAQTLRSQGETKAIAFSFKTLITGTPIVSLHLSTPQGRIIYSTLSSKIGLSEVDMDVFTEAVKKGQPISQKRHLPPAGENSAAALEAVETFAPLLGADGTVEGVLVIVSDITGPHARINRQLIRLTIIVAATFSVLYAILFLIVRRSDGIIRGFQMRERQRHAQKLEALSGLAGGMAHEFNNLLLPIMSLTDMTLRNMPEGSRDRSRLEKVSEASKRAQVLVNQVMAYSRFSKTLREHKNLYSLVSEIMTELHPMIPENIEISENLDPDIGTSLIDAEKIKMVMNNLLSNAKDAIGNQPGHIAVSLVVQLIDNPKDLDLNDLKGGLYGVLSVEDSGCGVDKKTMERAFDPFFTTKAVGKGSGMGLATVAGIVAEHEGAVDITSTPERGTRVDVYLPLI